MRRCPVCEKEQIQGPVCDNCGFDFSCDYEGRRTLCPILPGRVEPIAVCAAKWRQRQKQMIALVPGALVCPKCGGGKFSFLLNELQFMCADCETKLPIAVPKDEPVPESGPPAEKEAADVPDSPPVTDPAPAETDTAPAGTAEETTVKEPPSAYGQKELTAVICVHCGLVNPDTSYVCDHCATKLWRYSDPNAPKGVFLFGFQGLMRRYDHIKVDAAPPAHALPAKPPSVTVEVEAQPAPQKKSQSGSAQSMTAWGWSKKERTKIDRAFDILTDKS